MKVHAGRAGSPLYLEEAVAPLYTASGSHLSELNHGLDVLRLPPEGMLELVRRHAPRYQAREPRAVRAGQRKSQRQSVLVAVGERQRGPEPFDRLADAAFAKERSAEEFGLYDTVRAGV